MDDVGSGATPHGCSAKKATHAPQACSAASVAFIVDLHVPRESQHSAMAHAHSVMQQQSTWRETVVFSQLSDIIDFSTQEVAKSKWNDVSLGYYQKLVRQGRVVHEDGRTQVQMLTIARQFAASQPVKNVTKANNTLYDARFFPKDMLWQLPKPPKRHV